MSVYNQDSFPPSYISNNFSQKRVIEINESSKYINIGLSIISIIAIIGTTYSLNKEYFGAVLNTTSNVDMIISILTTYSLALVILGCVALTLTKNKQLKEQENLYEENTLNFKNNLDEMVEKFSQVKNEYLDETSIFKNKICRYKEKEKNHFIELEEYVTEIEALEENNKKLSQVKNEYLDKISNLEKEINKYKENEKNHLIEIKSLRKEND